MYRPSGTSPVGQALPTWAASSPRRSSPPVVSITNGSGQTIQSVCFLYNGHPPQPDHCGTAATNFTVPIMVGNPGDGQATFQAAAKDLWGNILASSSVYSQAIRINGLTNGTGTIPTSGSGIIAPLQWNGHNFGGACGGVFRVDGRENISPDDTFTNGDCNGGSPGSGQVETTFKSYRVPNGTHELWVTLNGDGMGTQFGGDPYIVGNTLHQRQCNHRHRLHSPHESAAALDYSGPPGVFEQYRTAAKR